MILSYGEAVKHFKELKQMDKVITLFNNKVLIEALLAWRGVKISYKEAGIQYEASSDNELWDKIWENVRFDMDGWAIVAGIKVQKAKEIFERLRGYRLIYPDGTIDAIAVQYINSIIIKELGLAKKSDKKSEKDDA